MRKNQLKNLSNKIAALENEIRLGNNIEKNEKEITILMSRLSFQELIQLEEYLSNIFDNSENF
jgi:hypothetical protein